MTAKYYVEKVLSEKISNRLDPVDPPCQSSIVTHYR